MDIGRRESRGLTSGKWEKTNGRFVRVLPLINPTGPQSDPRLLGSCVLTRPLLSGSITYTRVDICTNMRGYPSKSVCYSRNCVHECQLFKKIIVCSALAPFAARIGKWYALRLGCVSRCD